MNTETLTPKAARIKLQEMAATCESENYHTESAAYIDLLEQLELDGDESITLLLVGNDLFNTERWKIDPGAPDLRGFKLYVHNDKESNWTKWEELGGVEDEAGRTFSYTALEVELLCTVDMKTGTVKCQAVNGIPLREEVTV